MNNTGNESFLNVRDLTVEYSSEGKTVHAVNSVTFSLERGKTLALVGETGAGKTTIAKSIIGVLPDRGAKVKSGRVELEGRDLLSIGEKEMLKVRGDKIAMIFQDPMTALNPVFRVGDQIAEVIEMHQKVNKKEAKEQAVKLLNMVGIQSNRYRNYPHQFSGGMKQRVVIAMALACNPDLLLADEPTTALDVTIQAQILALIKELKMQKNTSMILITHDLGVVANISDEVAVVYAGEIIEYGDKKHIFTNPMHPYTNGLFKSIPDIASKAERLANIQGLPPDPTDLPAGCSFAPRCPYCTEKCSTQHPELVALPDGHMCRCFRALEEYSNENQQQEV